MPQSADVPRYLQRLLTLKCLFICGQIPKGWWGQASVGLFNTYKEKDEEIQQDVVCHPKLTFSTLALQAFQVE